MCDNVIPMEGSLVLGTIIDRSLSAHAVAVCVLHVLVCDNSVHLRCYFQYL